MACSKTARTVEGPIITKEEVKDRIVMIVKPEQSGKTFKMIELLNGFLQEEQERDDYEQCRKAELEAVQSGNLNFMFKPAWTVSRG